MTRKHSLSFFLILLCLPSYGHAQLWSGIIAPTRATDWTQAGVKGGIPSATWTQCGSTIAPYTGDASTINNALAACGTNQYVQLGAGTFTLSSTIQFNKSNVALRGMGANQTFIVAASGASLTGCGAGFVPVILMCAGGGFSSSNWTAGYSQGTTQITLSSVSGLSNGLMLSLDQADDPSNGSGGYPTANDVYVCQTTSQYCSNEGGGGNYSPAGSNGGRAQTEVHEVTNIAGTTVTITPPIGAPNWRSSQTPKGNWQPGQLNDVGLENLSIDWTNVQGTSYNVGIDVAGCKDCWFAGIRDVDSSTIPVSQIDGLVITNSMRVTVKDSYFFGPGANGTSIESIQLAADSSLLLQNNIIQAGAQAIYSNGPLTQSVIAYNFSVFPSSVPGNVDYDTHGAGENMNLFEGNIGTSVDNDTIHGSHYMQTILRNLLYHAPSSAFWRQPIILQSWARFSNVVGNVLGDSSYNTYQANETYNSAAIYELGHNGAANPTVNDDPHVLPTLLRWGNWDIVTNAVRWCGNSSDTGWATTCASTSEVPSSIPNFPNPVPTLGDTGAGQSAMPASFYLSSKPSGWVFPSGNATTPWPGIGPEVTGGNISNTGGHAYLNPAANCYLNVMHGPADGSGSPLSFNANACYAQSDPPAPPSQLAAVVH